MTEPARGPAAYFPAIEKKYGRTIAEWKTILRGRDLSTHKDSVEWLKAEYGLGHGHANALVAHTRAEDADS